MDMAFKTLLVDIDGVLIRDKDLLHHVRHNCVQYVKKKLPGCEYPARLNNRLYAKHGHTGVGLKNEYNLDVSDFNKEVYTPKVKSHLWEVLSSTEFQQEAEILHEIASKDWNVCLFTNTPIEWAGQVARAISDLVYVKCPVGDVYKPDPGFYLGLPTHHVYVYIDDSIRNLQGAKEMKNCKPVLFSNKKSDSFPTIGSIWELGLYVNSVDQWISDS